MSAYLQLEDPKTDDKSVKEKSFIFAGHTLNFYVNIGSKKGYWISTKKTSEQGMRDGWHSLPRLKYLERDAAPTGAVTVACHVEVNFQRMVLEELDTLSSDFKYLLGSDRKYDVTLDVQGKEFRAHRTVLSARSPVFRAMYEHDTAESKSGMLTINDSDPESFGGFLNFLYTGRVEDVSFETAFHLYSTADKYDVQQLNSLCADYLKQNLTLDTVCDLAVMADLHGDKHLMSSIQDYFNENYLMIFPTSMWKSMLENHLRLADKLLEDMAGEVSKSKCSSKKSTPGAEPSGDPPRSVLQPLPPIRSHFRPKKVNSPKRKRVTGEISGVAEFAQWRIPVFLSLNVQHGDYICSPRFLLAGCLWYLRVYPEGIEEDGRNVYAFLWTHDGEPITASRTVAIGLVCADAFVKEKSARILLSIGRPTFGKAPFPENSRIVPRRSASFRFSPSTDFPFSLSSLAVMGVRFYEHPQQPLLCRICRVTIVGKEDFAAITGNVVHFRKVYGNIKWSESIVECQNERLRQAFCKSCDSYLGYHIIQNVLCPRLSGLVSLFGWMLEHP